MIERSGVGGQAGVTDRIDNYPGFPTGVKGAELADNIRAQVERFVVEILQAQAVSHIMAQGDYRLVATFDRRRVLLKGACLGSRDHVPASGRPRGRRPGRGWDSLLRDL